MMMYLKSQTNKWDSCAGEAIITAMGGHFTTPSGQPIHYSPQLPN
jgi:3'-phosphoadenosine 5'-phosphosulfate (PAPS) 3'-phosphatase